VTLPSEAAAPGGAFPDVAVGQALQVTGAVDQYKGTPQLSVGRASDLLVLDEALTIAPSRRIAELSVGDEGRLYAVEGVVSRVSTFSAGVKCMLDDGSGTVTLLLWQDFYDSLPQRDALAPGATIHVVGEVSEYRGEMELVPELPSDVAVIGMAEVATVAPTPVPSPVEGPPPAPTSRPVATLPPTATQPPPSTATEQPPSTARPAPTPTIKPAPQPTPVPETRTIGTITASDVGSTFTVAPAGITQVDYFSAGVRYTVADATGTIILLLWQEVLEEIPGRYDLFPGSQVQITGEIDEYQGVLEIIPHRTAGVTVIDRGERAPIEERSATDIAPPDEGRVFVVEGRVTRTDSRQWLRLWLDDGTAQILIFVPERAVAYLPAGIGPGARLRVTGEVDIYQGQIEIIPLAGADVEVR
jgi:DNA/RNA endonuclease YhcR with UshA esterase domain